MNRLNYKLIQNEYNAQISLPTLSSFTLKTIPPKNATHDKKTLMCCTVLKDTLILESEH